MRSDCDVALLGTGLAPLVAARRFLAMGKTVLLINPDWDFFQEDSELSLDPFSFLGHSHLDPRRLLQNGPDEVLKDLRPEFPGAVELCILGGAQEKTLSDFSDPEAPHVRSRSRVWVQSDGYLENWDRLESMYVEASDLGLNPQLLEGVQLSNNFPGHSGRGDAERKAILIPRICDVDVDRYRNGMLEFLRERLDPNQIVCGATQIELMPGGIRYYSNVKNQKAWQTSKVKEGLLVFWTPKLTNWLFTHFKDLSFLDQGIVDQHAQVWEQWSLVSREPLNPSTVGTYEDLLVWAEGEGPFHKPSDRLSVLRPGMKVLYRDAVLSAIQGSEWASQESFQALSRLCGGLLRWDKFSIRSMKPRTLLQWKKPGTFQLETPQVKTWLVCGCDGPLTDVVRNSRKAAEILE